MLLLRDAGKKWHTLWKQKPKSSGGAIEIYYIYFWKFNEDRLICTYFSTDSLHKPILFSYHYLLLPTSNLFPFSFFSVLLRIPTYFILFFFDGRGV